MEKHIENFPEGRVEAAAAGAESSCERVLEEYLRLQDAGEAPDLDAFLLNHPEHASTIREFLAGEQDIRAAFANTDRFRLLQSTQGRFAGFQLIKGLGSGGMGDVYLARQAGIDRLVAVKVIADRRIDQENALARFKNEAKLAGRLNHPHVVAVHEAGQFNGHAFIAMDYVDGENLKLHVEEHRPSTDQIAKWMQKVAEAIAYAHQHDVLHRDMKPSNILIDRSTLEPLVSDFGLAKCLDSQAQLTATGEAVGTPEYIAPEQLDGKDSTASDIYGLGGVLYFLLTARPPHQGMFPGQTLDDVRTRDPVAPAQLDSTVPKDLETICLKCLARDPRQRYASAGEVAEDLERYRKREPILARPAGAFEKFRRWAGRNRTLAALLLLISAVAVAGPMATMRINRLRLEAEADRNQIVAANHDLETVTQFFAGVFRSPDPALDGKDVKLVDSLRTGCSEARERFANKPRLLGMILATIGSTYDGLNIPEESVPVLTESVELLSQTIGKDAQETLKARTELANSLRQASRVPESIALLRSVEASWSANHSIKMEDYYDVLSTLALALECGSQYDEAIRWQNTATTGIRKLFGHNDLATLSGQQALGWLHCRKGEFDQAKMLLETTVEQLDLMSNGESDRIFAKTKLGAVYRQLSMPHEAVDIQREALIAAQAHFGEDHAHTLHCMNSLAISLMGLGPMYSEEVKELYRRRYELANRRFGPDHGETAAAQANMLLGLEDVQERAEGYHRLIPKLRKTFGNKHDLTLSALQQAALVAGKNGQHTEALELLRETYSGTREVFGEAHPNTLGSKCLLAQCLAKHQRYEEAAALMASAASDSIHIHGKDRPESIIRGFRAVIFHYADGRDSDFIDKATAFLQMLDRAYGQPDTFSAEVRTCLARCLLENGAVADAKAESERALSDIASVNAAPFLIGYAHMVQGAIELQLGNDRTGVSLIRQGAAEMEADMNTVENKRPWLKDDGKRIERLLDLVDVEGEPGEQVVVEQE